MKFSASALVLAFALAACGGGGPTTTQQPGAPTVAPGQPTVAPGQPTPAVPPPAQGGAVATVILTGGADAGTYTATGLEPNCSLGLIGPGGWGVQLTNLVATDTELGSLQLVAAAEGAADDENAFFKGTQFLMTVTIGPSLGTSSRNYEVAVRTEAADQESSGTGSAQITDTGSTAVIHATGTTADGVGIDATVNCATVLRQ